MDKSKVINFINQYYNQTASNQDVVDFLFTYCLDRGKQHEDIVKFIQMISMITLPVSNLIDYAISWYARELNLTIISIIDKNNQLKPIKIYE
jgi:hypothetical protein